MKYQLEFCGQNSYASFIRAARAGLTLRHMCFIGISNLRMYLSLQRGEPAVEFYTKEECSWEVYTKATRKSDLDIGLMCHSAQEFELELSRVFFSTFPRAEESFYDELPNHKEIISALRANPTLRQAQNLHYIYAIERLAVDDADGIMSVYAGDGMVCIPFYGEDSVLDLQMYRAKFHPDSIWASGTEGFFDRCHRIWSKLTSLTLYDVLSKFDKIFN